MISPRMIEQSKKCEQKLCGIYIQTIGIQDIYQCIVFRNVNHIYNFCSHAIILFFHQPIDLKVNELMLKTIAFLEYNE